MKYKPARVLGFDSNFESRQLYELGTALGRGNVEMTYDDSQIGLFRTITENRKQTHLAGWTYSPNGLIINVTVGSYISTKQMDIPNFCTILAAESPEVMGEDEFPETVLAGFKNMPFKLQDLFLPNWIVQESEDVDVGFYEALLNTGANYARRAIEIVHTAKNDRMMHGMLESIARISYKYREYVQGQIYFQVDVERARKDQPAHLMKGAIISTSFGQPKEHGARGDGPPSYPQSYFLRE